MINNIIYTQNNNRIKFTSSQTSKELTPNNGKSASTIKKAATTFVLWSGFGICLDFLSRIIKFSKSPTKNSIAINAIIGSIAAIVVSVNDIKNKKQK